LNRRVPNPPPLKVTASMPPAATSGRDATEPDPSINGQPWPPAMGPPQLPRTPPAVATDQLPALAPTKSPPVVDSGGASPPGGDGGAVAAPGGGAAAQPAGHRAARKHQLGLQRGWGTARLAARAAGVERAAVGDARAIGVTAGEVRRGADRRGALDAHRRAVD